MKQNTDPSKPENLPDIPDLPLHAWRHYKLMRHIEEEIHQKLSSLSFQGHAIGLRVDYAIYPESGVVEPEPFSMQFGYVVKKIEFGPGPDSPIPADDGNPLTDAFLDELFAEINRMIEDQITPPGLKFKVYLETTVEGSERRNGVWCHRVAEGQCTRRNDVGTFRIFRQSRSGIWWCTHQSCG